ncbi:MAG: polysaccharide biosynthesis protein, partial [Cyanobacteria bacterium P01_E01_bin.35]
IFIVFFLPLSFYLMQYLGAIIAIALYDLPLYAVLAFGLNQHGLGTFIQDVQMTCLLVALVTLFLFCRVSLGGDLPIAQLLVT